MDEGEKGWVPTLLEREFRAAERALDDGLALDDLRQRQADEGVPPSEADLAREAALAFRRMTGAHL